MESLPLELIDYIVDLLSPSHGTEDLDALSRVSKAWRAHLLPRLFNRLTPNVKKMKQIYESKISRPTYAVASKDQSIIPFSRNVHRLVALAKTHRKIPRPTGTIASQQQSIPFSYVRHLIVIGSELGLEQHRAFLKILWLFTNVTILYFGKWDFQPFKRSDITKWFEHFGGTVRTLGIYDCFCSSAVLIFLKSLFPSVDDLLIRPNHAGVGRKYRIKDSGRAESAKFQGKLTFEDLDDQHDAFLAFVRNNCNHVHSITLFSCGSAGIHELFDQCKAGLTSVGFGNYFPESKCIHVCHPASLHHSSHNCAP